MSTYSKKEVKVGSIIIFDDTPNEKFKVLMCISLEYFGKKGYRLNLERVY